MKRRQTFNRKYRFAFRRRPVVEMFFLIADHLFDNPRNTGVADLAFADKAPVAENSDVVANFHQLFQTVGNIDNGDAAAFKLFDHVKQDFDFRLAERGSGFIHN